MQIARRFTVGFKKAVPQTFNYIGIKMWSQGMHKHWNSLESYVNAVSVGNHETNVQISRLDFLDENGSIYDIQGHSSDIKVLTYAMFNGLKFSGNSDFIRLSEVWGYEGLQYVFDKNTSSKMNQGMSRMTTTDGNWTVYDMQTNTLYHTSYLCQLMRNYYSLLSHSCYEALLPFILVLDVTDYPFDYRLFNRWQFYNGGDNAYCPYRTWTKGEILGSADMKKWYSLDKFDNINMPTTDNACVYTGNLNATPGDMWSELDPVAHFA